MSPKLPRLLVRKGGGLSRAALIANQPRSRAAGPDQSSKGPGGSRQAALMEKGCLQEDALRPGRCAEEGWRLCLTPTLATVQSGVREFNS